MCRGHTRDRGCETKTVFRCREVLRSRSQRGDGHTQTQTRSQTQAGEQEREIETSKITKEMDGRYRVLEMEYNMLVNRKTRGPECIRLGRRRSTLTSSRETFWHKYKEVLISRLKRSFEN